LAHVAAAQHLVLTAVSTNDITVFADGLAPPGAVSWVDGVVPDEGEIDIVAYDPEWPGAFDMLADRIRESLGSAGLGITHVGSTSVPGLAAKPIIDIDLIVADSADEPAYAPALEAAGFRLMIREPWWYGHRMLRYEGPLANVHVWSPGAAEPARHVLFRDWLREHAEDRDRYQAAKAAAAAESNARRERVSDYNARKQDVIRAIYARAFRARGLLD